MKSSSPLAHVNVTKRTITISLVSILLLSTLVTFTAFAVNKLHTASNPNPATTVVVLQGKNLPSERDCATHVHFSSSEPRSNNTPANQSVPTHQQIAQLAPWNETIGVDPKADGLRKQVTGNFTGTTDEIFQWVACKWGIDANIVRAEAIVESHWHQNQRGDYTANRSACPPGSWDGQGCYQSYGILQIKYIYNQSAWPMSRDNTAFSAEYVYGVIRTCFEGWATYLKTLTPLPGYPQYQAGDLWGCLGRWYSGGWYDQGAIDYIQKVKTALAEKAWLQVGF